MQSGRQTGAGLITAPAELAALPHWVAWRAEPRDGDKLTKVPYDVRTGRHASSTDPHTWATFEEACAFCTERGCEGVGFVLSKDDPYVGVDLDHCRDPHSGRIEPWAKAIIKRLNSYTEISPSGTGLRIFVRGELPPHGRRKGRIEIYSQARFLTITGQHVTYCPDTIQDRRTELLAWHTEVFGPPPEQRTNGHVQARTPVNLADADILLKARSAKNGAQFWALWNGDYSAYHSESEATLALLDMLAFWTGPDPARLDALFRSSGLMRDKWDERRGSATWGGLQIDKALSDRSEFYGGSSPRLIVTDTGSTVDTVTGEVIEVPLRFRFLTAAEVKNRPDPEFVIDRVLQLNTIALIVGTQESYKSFIAQDMAMSMAAGLKWKGHETRQGITAYISAEGGSGLGLRIQAWETANNQVVEHAYFLPDQAPQFLDRGQSGDVEELLRSLSALPSMPVAIFVDTLARTMVGGDENSAQDMGLFIASAEQIRQATGATVVLVHHNNKQGSARGSSALLGAVHTILECSREPHSPHVIVRCGKQKDADHFETMMMTARVISIGEDGRSSLVLDLREQGRLLANNEVELTKSAQVALAVLKERESVSYSEWRDKSGLAKTSFHNARTELERAGLVDHIADRYCLSSLGQMFGSKRSMDPGLDPMDLSELEGSKKRAPYGGALLDPTLDPGPWTPDAEEDF